jgi:glycine cleavage system H lipoate-binding protein
MSHDLFTLASSKAVEYGIAITFLVLFVPFWRYVQGGPLATAPVAEAAKRVAEDLVEWFRVARDVAFHPGHAWARVLQPGVALMGADDFAQKLVGHIEGIDLPAEGTELRQGEPAWSFRVDGRRVDMVSPVTGTVTAVNRLAASDPRLVHDDPYQSGWLLRVEGPRVSSTVRGLLQGKVARQWLSDATDALRLRMTPDLGLALQDGGVPVNGLAKAIDPEHWDEIAREHLLS